MTEAEAYELAVETAAYAVFDGKDASEFLGEATRSPEDVARLFVEIAAKESWIADLYEHEQEAFRDLASGLARLRETALELAIAAGVFNQPVPIA